VKVISILVQKMNLSLRDVDHRNGENLLPMKKNTNDDALRANPLISNHPPTKRIEILSNNVLEQDDNMPSHMPLKRMRSLEKWEANKLVASQVLDVRDYPMYDENGMVCFIMMRVPPRRRLRSI